MPADLVLLGGRVHAPGYPWADAVAVRAGRITEIGTVADLRPAIGPRTTVIDTTGRLVLPGFHDAHAHPVAAGLQLNRCELGGAASAADCLDLVAAHAASHPGPWILGGGWVGTLFPGGAPHRRDLDRLVPDRPAYLLDSDQHNAWVNSAALALAGIDATTPDPPGGRVGRDPGGEPDGLLHESAAELVGRLTPRPSADDLLAALTTGRDVLWSCGVTSWQDALVGPYLGLPDTFGTYLTAAERGLIDWRVAGALWWDRDRGPEQADDLAERRAVGRAAGFRATHVKIMQDGICENRTAALFEPYLDGGGNGQEFLEPQDLADAVGALDRRGFHAHMHAVGDRAVHHCLDAVAIARARNGRQDTRHHIAHAQVIRPSDVPRFRRLGVAAAVQPLWAAAVPPMTENIMPALGPRRSGWQYPFADLLRSGARLAAGSDWPVSSPDPLHGIHVAVNRTPATLSAPWLREAAHVPPFLPYQSIPVEAALAAYTIGSAHLIGVNTGIIAPSRPADLVVLDRDILTCPTGEIEYAEVELTFVAGRVVHSRQPAWSHRG
ncbi:amidohydrolase [Nonomuraea cavernae]|uniref:amidohydrolase n=1 Tax=Nonomuraea cavernae TaxID=2045107 RepID=UPI0034012458